MDTPFCKCNLTFSHFRLFPFFIGLKQLPQNRNFNISIKYLPILHVFFIILKWDRRNSVLSYNTTQKKWKSLEGLQRNKEFRYERSHISLLNNAKSDRNDSEKFQPERKICQWSTNFPNNLHSALNKLI